MDAVQFRHFLGIQGVGREVRSPEAADWAHRYWDSLERGGGPEGGGSARERRSGSNRLSIVPVDLEISEVAAAIRARTSLRLPDALIAASALARHAECIVTQDREFGKARTLVVPSSAKALADRVESI